MNKFEQNIASIYGSKGREWIAKLPKLIDKIADELHLSDLKPCANLTYNYVLSGFQGKKPIILKLGLDVDGLKREAFALKAFNGFGAVGVLSTSDGVLLLECAMPGTSLKSYFPDKDTEAMQVVCDVIKTLHKEPISGSKFPHIKDWVKAIDKEWDIPAHYLQKARLVRDQLLKTSANEVLLHGDLHHDNILQHNGAWVVIDPKGVVGDASFEVGTFIRNPIPELLNAADPVGIIRNRIDVFSRYLDIDSQRITQWSYVQGVLGWIWGIEDATDITYFTKVTKFFDELVVI